MIDEPQEELASLYALDALTGEERQEFERQLAADPTLVRLVQNLREAAAAMARLAVVTPPPELKARILASIASEASAVLSASGGRPRSNAPIIAFRAYLPWAVAAGFAVLGLWLCQRVATTRGELALARQEAELASLESRSARSLLESERIVVQRQVADLTQQLTAVDGELVTLTRRMQAEGALANLKITALASLLNQSPEARAVAVWDPARQEGVLKVEKLPALLPTQDYQLWVVDPQYPNPLDGGVFTVDAQSGEARIVFTAKQPVAAVNAFAVTLERKGGVPKAEGPFVLLGK